MVLKITTIPNAVTLSMFVLEALHQIQFHGYTVPSTDHPGDVNQLPGLTADTVSTAHREVSTRPDQPLSTGEEDSSSEAPGSDPCIVL